jgi:hypothetical protein
VQCQSTAQAFSNVKNTVGSALEALTIAICKVGATPTPIPETSMFSRAIFTVAEDADFSQNDMNDASEIFINKLWVAEMYGAIIDASACTCFLHKRLNEFQAKKFDDI